MMYTMMLWQAGKPPHSWGAREPSPHAPCVESARNRSAQFKYPFDNDIRGGAGGLWAIQAYIRSRSVVGGLANDDLHARRSAKPGPDLLRGAGNFGWGSVSRFLTSGDLLFGELIGGLRPAVPFRRAPARPVPLAASLAHVSTRSRTAFTWSFVMPAYYSTGGGFSGRARNRHAPLLRLPIRPPLP